MAGPGIKPCEQTMCLVNHVHSVSGQLACDSDGMHFDAGLLGAGQEAGAAQALSLRQLAHFILQVHQGKLLRSKSLSTHKQLYQSATGLLSLLAASWTITVLMHGNMLVTKHAAILGVETLYGPAPVLILMHINNPWHGCWLVWYQKCVTQDCN